MLIQQNNFKYLKKNKNNLIFFNKKILILYNNMMTFILYLKKYIKNIKIVNNEISITLNNVNDISFILIFLKNHFKYQFKELVDICTVDYYINNQGINNRFQINYMLLSLKYKTRLKIKLFCNETIIIPSVMYIFSSAGWLERENWDMFGIFFSKHKDLRRILTDYGFNGFPFRKDFPLSGYIELRYDDEKKIVVYELLEMSQEFRFFEFINPWDWNISINKF